MLSIAEISSRIENPNLVVPDDLSSLKELTEKYPYTQLFSILYLKALSASGDVRFEDELKRHSYRISDRGQLYELIQNHASTDAEIVSTDSVTPPTIVAKETTVTSTPEPKTITSPVLEEPPIEKEIEVSISTETIEATQLSSEAETSPTVEEASHVEITDNKEEYADIELIQEVPKEEPLVEEPTSPVAEDKTIDNVPIVSSEEIPIAPADKLEESILHHVYASNYQLEDLTEEEEISLEEKDSEVEPSETESRGSNKTEKEAPASFTGWLHSNSNYTERDTSDKKAIDAVVEDFAEFDPSSELFGEIEKPKTEFFSPTKKAKKSLEENELPVSETLAKIYIMQGNYPQAISAYKQLSLAFPEKKIFFANLIEDLEKKINT